MFFVDHPDLRVSDAERDAAVDFLNRHYAAGRLTDEEHAARVDAIHRARYDSQLEALTDDLPDLGQVGHVPGGRRPLGAAVSAVAVAVGVVALAAVVPPDAWALLLGLALPLLMMLLFTVAPLALPVLAFVWLARGMGFRELDERPRQRLPRRL